MEDGQDNYTTRRQVVQGITSADLQKAAKQLVKGKNHVTIVMRPEE